MTNRATLAYLTMAMLFAAGLWMILAFGGTLRAPEDLNGAWQLENAGKMTIDQSGRFFEIQIEGLPHLSLRLKELEVGTRGPLLVRLLMEGQGHQLMAEGVPKGNEFWFKLSGGHTGQWRAWRGDRAKLPAGSTRPSHAL